MSPKLQEELLQQMARLSEEEQQRVLAFVKDLTPTAEAISDKNLLKFSGVIGQADLQAMTKAIEEECKR
jgi:hypothetical protein